MAVDGADQMGGGSMHRHDSMETFEANAAATGILPHPHKRVKPQTGAPPAAPQGDVAMGSPEKANPASRTSKTTLSQMTGSRFADLAINPLSKRGLAECLRYEFMTVVQEQSLPVALTGVDVLAKAKTGTGKTLSFLIPAVEACLRAPGPGQIKVLAVSPTRELAQQIMDEGVMLCKFHAGFRLQCIVGGTNMGKDLAGFKHPPDILVATPGRLNDHLSNSGLDRLLSHLRVLIFDEADQLLDMGFRPAILEMLSKLPPKNTRQCLLFSATMPTDVKKVAEIAMRGTDYTYVDTVGSEENTHQHVDQFYVVCSMQTQFAELFALIQEGMQVEGFKIIAFFTTARQTQFFAELFQAYGIPVLEIHSRRSQSQRNKVSDTFRESANLVMFTSDVSARGMDYPDVTRVIQVGQPSDRAQYIHRLGRTARAGKDGSGVLLLCDYEDFFLREVKDLPLQKRANCSAELAGQLQPRIAAALARLPDATFGAAYQAWMGFYNSSLRKLGWSKEDLVYYGNQWITTVCGRSEIPALEAKTVGKMGLKGVPGLVIGNRDGGGGGGGGRAVAEQAGGGHDE